MKRVLTTLVLLPLVLAAIFYLPEEFFWLLVVALVEVAVWECVRITASWAPGTPRWLLLLTVPATAGLLSGFLLMGAQPVAWSYALGALVLLSVGVGALLLLAGTPVAETAAAFGIVGWGSAYFGTAAVSLWALRVIDPKVLLLLLAVVWIGDSAAYYIGTMIGRHKMAPIVSPKKSWEGAAASLTAALLVAIGWSSWQLGFIHWQLVASAGVAGVFAQMGDLTVSMFKRGGGVKDSGTLLPGHGGMWDRLDATLFAAPVFLLALWLIGFDASTMP